MERLLLKVGWWLDWSAIHGNSDRSPVSEVFLRIQDRSIDMYIPDDPGPGTHTWPVNTFYHGREWVLPFHLNPDTELTAADVIGLLAFEGSGTNCYTQRIKQSVQHAKQLIEALNCLDLIQEQNEGEKKAVAALEALLDEEVKRIKDAYATLDNNAVSVAEALRIREQALHQKLAWRGLGYWDAKELNFIKHKTGDEKLLAEEDDRKFIRHILELRRTYLRHLPNPGTKDKEELAKVEQSLKELKEEVKK